MVKKEMMMNASTESAPSKLLRFLKEEKIILDYEIVNEPMFPIHDGLVLKPKNPLIKITARYG